MLQDCSCIVMVELLLGKNERNILEEGFGFKTFHGGCWIWGYSICCTFVMFCHVSWVKGNVDIFLGVLGFCNLQVSRCSSSGLQRCCLKRFGVQIVTPFARRTFLKNVLMILSVCVCVCVVDCKVTSFFSLQDVFHCNG